MIKILIYHPHVQAHKIHIEILKKSLDQFNFQYKEVNEKESLIREIENNDLNIQFSKEDFD
jgi:tRNA(Met) C34 N-acetyltransferase TmcA